MPIDPNIALGIRPVQPPMDPFQTLATLQELRDRQQMSQERDLANQQKQSQLDDETALNQAIQAHATPDGRLDTNGVMADLQRAGRGNAVSALQSKMLDWNEKQANAIKTQSETMTKNLTQ